MKCLFRIVLWSAVFCGAGLWAQSTDEILPNLPQALVLPASMTETLPLNKTNSFFGDALHAVDCTDNADLPYGTCGNQLFGGLVMTDSHLNGSIQIQFYPPVNNVAHFQVIHGTLSGDDGVLSAPLGYQLPVLQPEVIDAPLFLSNGDLNLLTGGVTNLQYYVLFRNSAIDTLLQVNPAVDRPVVQFPGIRGNVWARFDQRADGLLDFTFRGSTFLALGETDDQGNFIRFPLPFCNPLNCASIVARGTSLHPHLYLSTKAPSGSACAPNCPNIPTNTIVQFDVFSYSSSFGDNFDLGIPQLGGPGNGRSHIAGRMQIQFGSQTGDTVSFVVQGLVPQGLMATPPPNPIFGPAFVPGLLGQEEFLTFPLQTYRLQDVAVVDEPFDIIHGAVNLNTGQMIQEMVYPSFFAQSLAVALFEENAGRISTDAFQVKALQPLPGQTPTTYALFQTGPNGQLEFRYSGMHKRSFFTFYFPAPDLLSKDAYLDLSPFATLDLFLRIQAAATSDTPSQTLTGGATNVLSSVGDRFSYNFMMPCAPDGAPFTFQYTNSNSGSFGGTFTMNRLSSVRCFNSLTSTQPSGSYDTVSFGGFGTWSKDPANSTPRFATAQVSLNPAYPYVGIMVYQEPDPSGDVILSSANTKPAVAPLP